MKLYAVKVSVSEESYTRKHRGFSAEWEYDEEYTKWNCRKFTNEILGIYGSMRKADKAIKDYQINSFPHNLDTYHLIYDRLFSTHARSIREEGSVLSGLRMNRVFCDIWVENYELNK